MLAYAIVHALVMPAQDNEILHERQLVGDGLVEDFAIGRGENHLVILALAFELLYASVHWLDLHHHAGLSAKWVVIDLAMLAQRPVAQVVYVNFHKPLVLSALHYAAVQWRLQGFGHHSEYIYSHDFQIIFVSLVYGLQS